MIKNLRISVLACLMGAFLFGFSSFAEEEAGSARDRWRKFLRAIRKSGPEKTPAPEAARETPGASSFSRNELIRRIEYVLAAFPEGVDIIPELRITRDENKNIAKMEYRISGVFRDIRALDKKLLMKIYSRVNNEFTRIQTERIQDQLRAAGAARRVPKPPPRVYTPPSPPRIPAPPATPPKVPRVPSPPPAPPRR
jgi:hypothetical protein